MESGRAGASDRGSGDLRLLITIHLVITTEETADVLTKALPKDDYRFKKFRDILMNITD